MSRLERTTDTTPDAHTAGSVPPSLAPASTGPTVFFDGGCPLCNAEIGLYRRCGGGESVTFVDVAKVAGQQIAPDLDTGAALKRFHVRTADGALVSGAEAFGHLWLALPSWRWLGRVTLLPGVLLILEVAYRGFLVLRPAIQWVWRFASRRQNTA
jgi:predicted DCC family thiol-disulfide oxidoreductase YuxK